MAIRYGVDDGARDMEQAVAELAERCPQPLEPLARIVFNYRWTWLPGASALFASSDRNLWRKSCCNPRWLVESLPPRRMRELAADPGFLQHMSEIAQRIDSDLERPAAALPVAEPGPVAYFCAEFGAHCSLPLYGGGLGVLAGDLVKAASDLAVPMVGVGLLYTDGYFHQRLDLDGWQREYWIPTFFERLPAVVVRRQDGSPLTVSIPIRGRDVELRIWRVDFGRVPIFLLDADHHENHPIDRWITRRLYIGDRQTRLAQYAVLGAGGVRALDAMGILPSLVHLNEGHAALSSMQRAADLVEGGLDWDEALAKVREQTVFTTHTPVAAGNESYERDEVEPVLGSLGEALGVTPERLYGAGRPEGEGAEQKLAISALALRTSRTANAVSRRHGEVAREMWRSLWPGRSTSEVPIDHVTNGVHTSTWMAAPMAALLDKHLGPDWSSRLGDPEPWSGITQIPDGELWAVRNELRGRLVEYAREHSVFDRLQRGESPAYVEAADRMFDPDCLTIGFARRVATYKRLSLLTRHLDRAQELLANSVRPVQLVLAGKAHPHDDEAKETLRALLASRYEPNFGSQIVFLEDYDMHSAPRIVAGVDLWLNLPRPPLEASGTSGMKVAANGGLNLSVLDGWWAEAYDGQCGWGISSPDLDPQSQDELDATAVYNLLENDVVPLFYDRGEDGIPHRWLARVKHSMQHLIPRFSAERMLRDYVSRVYSAEPRS